MVTIKGGKLKGGTTKKKKHYMDDRKPQQMRAKGSEPGTKRVGPPKKLEGALNKPKAKPNISKPNNTKTIPNKPKAAPKGDSYGGPLMVRPKAKPSTGPDKTTYGQLMNKKPKAKPNRKVVGRMMNLDGSNETPVYAPDYSKRRNSISISRETLPGKALGFIVSGSASRTDEQRKKRARAIRASQK